MIYVNDAFAASFGLSPARLLGRPLSELSPQFQREDVLQDLERRCRNKKTYRTRGPLVSGTGFNAPACWHIAPVFRESQVENLICLVTERPEKNEPIEALRAREKRYHDLFEHGLIGKAILDTDGNFEDVNQSFCDMVGYTREELTGIHCSLIITEEDYDDVFGRLERLLRGELPGYQLERKYLRKNGTLVTALVDVIPDSDEHGKVHAIVIQAQDISGLKAVEASLRESENQLKAIYDHIPVELYLKDAQGRYIRVNRQFEQTCKVRSEDLQGDLPEDLYEEDLAERTRQHDLEVLRSGKVVAREEHFQSPDPDDTELHTMHVVKFPIRRNGEITGLGGIGTDITEIKRAEQALRESERRLRDFAEIAADWFWETDENMVVTYISEVHRYVTGIPDELIIGRTRQDLFRENIYRAQDPALHLRTLDHHWESMIEYSVVRDDGHEIFVHDRATPYFDQQGEFRGFRGVGRNVTEQKRLNERIVYQATYDPLTGAVNRREFERRLNEAIATDSEDERFVLCFTDLDKFKLLNDTLGHAAGDYTLRAVVETIQEHLSGDDLLGRIGGDEFGILLKGHSIHGARRLAERITRAIETRSFKWQERSFSIYMSMGLVVIDDQSGSGQELLARADAACYRAKETPGETVWVSDESEALRLNTYASILRSLVDGPLDLSTNFRLVGQPICSLVNREASPAWYEVLLRLVGDDGALYKPSEFIRLAEQHGRMPMIDRWVLETAIALHVRLIRQVPDAVLSINLAGGSMNRDRLEAQLDVLLSDHPVQPRNLCFEISEAAAMADLEQTRTLVEFLSRGGFQIALDEFGGGPSPFECLKTLPVQHIKLYGKLIRELRPNGPDVAIIESIRDLCRRLDVSMVAVQVETGHAADTLSRIGVEYAQGDSLAATRPLQDLIPE